RRARMLSVEDAPVSAVPVMSVPVMAPDNWLHEEEEAEPEPARFLSQDEQETEEVKSGERFYFSSSQAATISTTVNVVGGATKGEDRAVSDTAHAVGSGAPRDGQRNSESGGQKEYTPLPRDYAQELAAETHAPAPRVENRAQSAPAVFPDPGAEPEADLDVPAFMRRLQF
ncbi:MAG: hypothetical protein ACRD25_09855, partial [Terracidiphilus sp.]